MALSPGESDSFMTPERWERVKELFEAAREREPGERHAFLNEVCHGDDALRAEIESLLSGDRRAVDFLQKPALAGTEPTESTIRQGTLSVGQVLSDRFQIVRLIGYGGMGEVYEAKDLKLGGRVALKTIKPEIAAQPRSLERFKKEIQLARRVTHRSVCRMIDLGLHGPPPGDPQAPVVTFLTMELLEGETLAARLRRVGRIGVAEALPLVEQMAEALAAAHDAGVVHRDFKPGNVMLVPSKSGDKGVRAIVTDFGLARAVAAADQGPHQAPHQAPDRASDQAPTNQAAGENPPPSVTADGRMIGTIAYMAPEQLQGGEATPATDIYALGLVMYEMVAGKRPFPDHPLGGGPYQRLTQPPQPPRALVPDLDPRWDEAILRCLEIDPRKRFDSALDVVAALKTQTPDSPALTTWLRQHRVAVTVGLLILVSLTLLAAIPATRHRIESWMGAAEIPQERQLAVLPFTVAGGDPESKAFADGLTETLTMKLSQLMPAHPLQVVPSSEVRAQGVSTAEQARQQFGVNLVVAGALQRSGGMVRITLVVIDAKTRRQVSGDSIDAAASDPFLVEDEVVTSAVAMLRIKPGEQEQTVLTAHGTLRPAAYDYYLRGHGYLQEYQKPENIESAIALFQRALEIDANYALAYAGLGTAYWHKYDMTENPDWANQALAACQRSAALQPQLADAHACLGTVYQGIGGYQGAAQQFQAAVKLDPANDDAYGGLALALESSGKAAEAESTYREAIRLRPQYWAGYNRLGKFYVNQARYADAAAMFSQVIELAPDNYLGHSNLGGVYLEQGRYGEAVPELERSIAIQPAADAYSNLATAYFHMRRFADATRILQQAVKLSPQDYVMWGNLGDAEYKTPGRGDDASSAYRQAISLALEKLKVNPHDTDVMSDLADYYSVLGDRTRAVEHLASALRQKPDDPDLRLKAAEVYSQLGDREEAVKWITQALAAGISPALVRDTPALDSLRADPRVKIALGRERPAAGKEAIGPPPAKR